MIAISATMSRQVSKTYGRPSESSSAFDDAVRRASGRDKIFNDGNKRNKIQAKMASSTITKFGKTSFTSTRNSQVIEVESRKRPLEMEEVKMFHDPFSFDDEAGPSNPRKNQRKNQVTSAKTLIVNTQGSNGRLPVNAKPLTKSYVRPVKTTKISNMSDKQTTIDNFMTKVQTPSEPSPSSDCSDLFTFASSLDKVKSKKPIKNGNKKATKAKFFTSKNVNVSPGSDDHNYSANLAMSQSNTRDDHNYSHSDRDRESPDRDTWESDIDSDWDIETGDPEIIINSPHKKRELAVGKMSMSAARNINHQLELPITVNSSGIEDNDSVSVCSIKSTKTESVTSDEDLDCFSFKRKTVRTYGKSNSTDSSNSERFQALQKKSSVNCDSESLSLRSTATYGKVKNNDRKEADVPSGQGSGSDMYSGLTARKSAGLGLKKLNLSEERKTEKLNKPLVRRLLTSPDKKEKSKLKAVYNPRSWQSNQESEVAQTQKSSASSSLFDDFDDGPSPNIHEAPIMKRKLSLPSQPWQETVSSLKITRQHKPLFTVVRNVKQAHECQEHGEAQEFEDEILYILEGVKNTESIPTRCLSTMSLASKCTVPAFRMHLRAHNTLIKVFDELQDAPQHPTLALCTASVMYMVSRDRMNMDIDKSTLQLMLALLSIDSQQMAHCGEHGQQKEYDNLCRKVSDITQNMQKHGGVKNNKQLAIPLEDVSIGYLAMETLLSLTSKSAGDWFKEELRTSGGLDHIMNTVTICSSELDEVMIEPSESMLEKCSKIDRCLRVLENITYLNSDNQMYLISFNGSQLLTSLQRTLRVCENCMPFNQVEVDRDHKVNKECVGYIVYSCMLSVLRVLLNITHDNVVGCTKIGQIDSTISTVLACILRVPQYVPMEERFDILVLGLGLIINMVEHCEANRRILVSTKTCKPYGTLSVVKTQVLALEALSLLFNQCHEAARMMEEEHDAELEERENMRESRPVADSQSKNNTTDKPLDKSGEWKESEAGLEWVVIPTEDSMDSTERSGTLRDALKSHYNQDNFDDASSEGGSSDDLEVIPASQEEDEHFTKALHKYGRHMEDSIVAAYVALVLGCVVQGNMHLADIVRDYMPGCTFDGMIRMLKKFLGFMNFTSSTSNTGSKSITRVIEMLDAMNDS